MPAHATENTITTLLAKELERLGVHATPFAELHTPKGKREIDVLCSNGGLYPCEAKFSENDLLKAVEKIQNDYLKYHKALNVKGGFAVLHPKELTQPVLPGLLEEAVSRARFKAVLMFLPEDARKSFSVIEGTLSEVASEIAKQVLSPPEYVEPSLDYIIKTLRESAHFITKGLRHLSGEELEELFGGEHVFQNILQYEKSKYPVEDLRLASAYLLVNQLLFYHILSRKRGFPEIDPDRLNESSELNDYFSKVLEINYRVIFSYDVASRIPPIHLEDVRTIISVIQGLSPEKVGGDLLGTVFHDLIPLDVRKVVAAFYTNPLAAEMLAWLALHSPEAKVADLAVGSGGLLVAAYRRKRALLGRLTQEDHQRFVEEQLLGVDVMPFAASVAASHIALQSPEHFTDKVNIAIWDSTDLEPDRVVPSIANIHHIMRGQTSLWQHDEGVGEGKKGAVGLTQAHGDAIQLSRYDLVIMNPPFTRQERIPEEYKLRLNERFEEYGSLSGQLGYHGYFILLADRFLNEGGRMALVIPATVLRIKSFEGVRKLWADGYHVEHIITTWHRSAFSESTRFREILVVARKGKAKDAKTTITVLKRLPETPEEAREMAEVVEKGEEVDDSRLCIRVHPYDEVRGEKNWFRFIAVSEPKLRDFMKKIEGLECFEAFSKLMEAEENDLRHYQHKTFHGFILKNVRGARKSRDVWMFERLENKEVVAKHTILGVEIKIPLKVISRGLRRLSYVDKMDVTDDADYLITDWLGNIKEMASYLLTTKELESLNFEVVDKWKKKFESRRCHLLIGRRFDISAPGTSLISFYSDEEFVGIDFWSLKGKDEELTDESAKMLCMWFNSTFGITELLIERTETRGAWMKVHNYMLEDMKVPNPSHLTKKQQKLLLSIFNEVSTTPLPSILEQLKEKHPVRRRIDEAWMQVLGLDVDLDWLYGSLAKEIELLKEMMREGHHS